MLALTIKQFHLLLLFGNKVNVEVMRGHKMSRLCFLIFLSLALSNLCEAKHEKHVPAVLVGSVYCDTCFEKSFSKVSHFVSGADVAVQCSGTKKTPKFKKVVSTNKNGKFKVHLPFSVSKHVKKIKRCSVKLIKSSDPFCAVASTANSSELHFKTNKEGKHIFSAGFFTFKPSKQPKVCDQNPSVQESKPFESQKTFITNPNDPRYLPPLGNPPTSDFPPIVRVGPLLPQLPKLPPLPSLPELPPFPGIPLLPGWPPRASKINGTTQNSQVSNQKVTQTQFPTLPPLPALPPLPPLPGLPFFPPWPPGASTTKDTTKKSQVSNQKVAQTQYFGPNPFRPPSLFAPLIPAPPTSTFPPAISSPPTSVFPPIIRSPLTSPPSLFPPVNLPPPTPTLFPMPSLPSTPPVSQFPLPPFPFQPQTGIPGAPPAAKPISLKNSSP